MIAFSFSSVAQISFAPQVGYSWSYGVVGAELQFNHFAFAGGYFPTKMPGSGEPLSSFSGAIIYYSGNQGYSTYGYYTSIAYASAGYRYEESYNGGAWTGNIIEPMTIVNGGVYGASNSIIFKAGVGYGWCEYGGAFTFEVTMGYRLFVSKGNL